MYQCSEIRIRICMFLGLPDPHPRIRIRLSTSTPIQIQIRLRIQNSSAFCFYIFLAGVIGVFNILDSVFIFFGKKHVSRQSARPFLQGSELGPLHPQASVSLTFGSGRGGNTRLRVMGMEGPNSDEGTDPLVL